MQFRPLAVLTFALVSLLLPACTGGSSNSNNNFNAKACPTGGTFCLRSCSLGCVASGCQVTEIAQNQPIVLEFSQPVDPASVNATSISIKTSNGEVPIGSFQIDGNKILFVPEIRISGGRTLFGFGAGKTYLLSLPTDATGASVLRSIAGDVLVRGASCQMSVTQGIVDLNAAPPKPTLLTPTIKTNVPANAVIVIEFDELIDISPFRGATTETSPITYVIRKTREKPGSKGVRECDPNFKPIPLEGLPKAEINANTGTTTVTLKPTTPLPSQVCVQVEVTSRVRDLAGKPAARQLFEFTTNIVSTGPASIVETFGSSNQLDTQVSAGEWKGGTGLPPQIGGTGIHGTFVASIGKLVEIRDPKQNNKIVDRYFEWDTDNMKIPGRFTQSGKDETVTDGVFHFTDFFLVSGVKVVFKGTKPAVINVRGKCQIDGIIQANAPALSLVTLQSDKTQLEGQKGGIGGPGGAKGGNGGKACDNKGSNASFNGSAGEDVKLASGHAYSTQAAGTGGKGSALYPSSGKLVSSKTSKDYDALGVFAAYTAPGGSGGGLNTTGGLGKVDKVPPATGRKDSERIGPAAAGGKAYPIASFSPKTTSLGHFLIGGAGGGGGSSHPLLTTDLDKFWLAGAAGAGGGGCIALRIGQTIAMKGTGRVEAKGGDGAKFDGVRNFANVPCPGGGGSGGTVLLQVLGTTTLGGKIDTSGGKGGVTDNSKSTLSQLPVKTSGGNGSPGYIRLERPNGATTIEMGSTVPKATGDNVGKLTDSDKKTASQSKFYSTKLTFPPSYTRYELEVKIDGKRRVYSDVDISKNEPDYAGRATESSPVWVRFQAAKVSTVTGLPDLETAGPWRDFVTSSGGVSSINKDLGNGFRFLVVFDQTSGTKIELLSLTVHYTE